MATRRTRNWPSVSGSQQERATEAFRRLEDLTRLISDWVWETDGTGTLTYVSDRIIDRLGILPVDAVGKRLDEIGSFTDRFGEPIASPNLKRPFREVGFSATAHDGDGRMFSISGLPRFDRETGDYVGVTGIAKDITEISRIEQANARLADAIEVMSEYFALYDENDRLVISNARYRESNISFGDAAQPGGSFEDLLRLQVESGMYPEANANPDVWIRQRMANRRRRHGSFESNLSDGRCLLVEEEQLPDGGIVMMLRDITQMKQAISSLESRSEHHREFASSVAHRLRTPLAVLRSSLDNLGDDEKVTILKREVDVLARMIEQLLTLTRYEYFVLPEGEVANLREVAISVVSSLAPIAIKDGRSVELTGHDGPVWVRGNAGALEHGVRNIVENAIKYASRGSTVELRLDDDPAIVSVIDQGRGIPLDQRQGLFEPFSRIDRRGSGAGLGLNIVKAIAEIHDAEISIADNPVGGTIVSLRFPPFDAADSRKIQAL